MGEGFIVRRGGGGQQTVKPIFNSLTSVTFTSLTLSVTNDSNSIATLYYSVVQTEPGPTTPDTFETEFDGKETKDITITGLTSGTTYTVYIKAIAVGEFPSETVSVPNLTTGVAITATGGTTLEYDLDSKRYRSHTFTGNGTFQVTQLSNISGFNDVDYLIIAGGGGGGQRVGGGGGAGGYRTTLGTSGANSSPESKVTVTATSYGVTVGLGGAGATANNTRGQNGTNSSVSFPTTITSTGGGAGSSYEFIPGTGLSGGSGGGGSYYNPPASGQGGAGTAGQGRNGGNSFNGSQYGGGGGGGASAVGVNATTSKAGDGGAGLANLLRTGSNETRAGGGGAGASGGTAGAGGIGGGGAGKAGQNLGVSTSGAVNTGSGGGGGSDNGGTGSTGGAGGSGIVVIRYEIAPSV
jgi:hypothetical protein